MNQALLGHSIIGHNVITSTISIFKSFRFGDFLEEKKLEQDCVNENFYSKEVIDRVKKDIFTLSNVVRLLNKVQKSTGGEKKKIWKPNHYVLPKGVGEIGAIH